MQIELNELDRVVLVEALYTLSMEVLMTKKQRKHWKTLVERLDINE